MKILTAANKRMSSFVLTCLRSAKKMGYPAVVYDLGGLGFGKPFNVENRDFQEKGYYSVLQAARQSRGFHKPQVILDHFTSRREFTVYLDADTVITGSLDGLSGDYDVGLTVRPEWEIRKVIKSPKGCFLYDGYINAGVMCFNPTAAARRFLEEWQERTTAMGNDQGALNGMLKDFFPLKSGQAIERNGVKIRTFDTLLYNHYYLNWPQLYKDCSVTKEDIKVKWQDAKILHFKGNTRPVYFLLLKPFSADALSICLGPAKKKMYQFSAYLKEKFPLYRRLVALVKREKTK